MPHQCIECGRTFPDGSKEMLSGCPDCGGNKFQFRPAGQETTQTAATTDAHPQNDSASESERTDSGPPSASGSPSSSDSRSPSDSPSPTESDPSPAGVQDEQSGPTNTPDVTNATNATHDREEATQRVHDEGTEDAAQASARSDVVSRDELDRASQDVPATETPDPHDSEGPRPDVDELRSELNDQFESIRIVSPGQYELNLMELYDRQEYIISLQEDGRYVIEMPDAWGVED